MTLANPTRLKLRRVLLLLLALTLAGWFIVWLLLPPDPTYEGKRLSTYLYRIPNRFAGPGVGGPAGMIFSAMPDQGSNVPTKVAEALEALGPKAVPMIASWLNTDSEIRVRLRKLAASNRRFVWLSKWRWLHIDPRDSGFQALEVIPRDCASLVPILRRHILAGGPAAIRAEQGLKRIAAAVSEEQSRELIDRNRDLLKAIPAKDAHALDEIGERSAQIAAILHRRRPQDEREVIFRRVWPFREANPGVRHALFLLDEEGFLHNMLYLESGSPSQKASAAFCFRDFPRSPERIVPLLSSNLLATDVTVLWNTCEALGSYQTNATSALPLLEALKARNPASIGIAASKAMERIMVKQ